LQTKLPFLLKLTLTFSFQIGALSLQLVESELKRYDLWHDQYVHAPSGEQRRKWELAMRKQEVFLVECLKILANLSTETKTEVKMVSFFAF
jgi:hypothetical protein